MKFKLIVLIAVLFVASPFMQAQKEASPFDFGKMWTFENPPKEWFLEEYRFEADDQWFADVRMASLRFASWCSASFVSKNGLLMTNHHCAQPVAPALQRDGEDFDKDGFYAQSQGDERRSQGLFVEQLHKVQDITDKVKSMTMNAENDADRATKTQEALASIQEEFSSKLGWEELRLQLVTFYSGGKYSIYGYKRYDDIRLVFMPELDLGFFGGDPDNFTYPRYNLDCTFWRVYGDDGQPLNTANNYFKFNIDGVKKDEPVFVIGNPGTTERYRTVAQLEYDRDYRYPTQIEFFENRMAILEEEYEKNPTDDLQGNIFGLSNTLKATWGAVNGLNDSRLFDRKVQMEKKIRSQAGGATFWDELATSYAELSGHSSELRFLQPNPMNGTVMNMLGAIYPYLQGLKNDTPEGELASFKDNMTNAVGTLQTADEKRKLAMVLGELQKFALKNDTYIGAILKGRTPEQAASNIIDETIFSDEKKFEKLMSKKPKKILKEAEKDPIMVMAQLLMPKFENAIKAFQSTGPMRRALEEKVANAAFNVYGTALPPDATFTLRISDGRVKSYDYNGTKAPIMTTYFGMYDRHYSNGGEFPWSLPDRWMNPSMDLLKSPMNFINTCDIIGGNSGSPVVNMRKECVGLVFDGNIESLPGKFIFDEESNRTVSVHAGGIVAALRYIYKADRIVSELLN